MRYKSYLCLTALPVCTPLALSFATDEHGTLQQTPLFVLSAPEIASSHCSCSTT